MRCIICGRKLTSEKSILAGIGSGCRGNKNGRRSKVLRTVSFEKSEEFSVGKTTWKRKEDGSWEGGGTSAITTDNLRKYLIRYDMIIRVEDVSQTLWQDILDGKFDMTKFEEV